MRNMMVAAVVVAVAVLSGSAAYADEGQVTVSAGGALVRGGTVRELALSYRPADSRIAVGLSYQGAATQRLGDGGERADFLISSHERVQRSGHALLATGRLYLSGPLYLSAALGAEHVRENETRVRQDQTVFNGNVVDLGFPYRTRERDSRTALAGYVGAGLTLPLSERLSVELEGRHAVEYGPSIGARVAVSF
jgi:hypothetical protein